jgi:outer membrane lipoprotein-sorting protein
MISFETVDFNENGQVGGVKNMKNLFLFVQFLFLLSFVFNILCIESKANELSKDTETLLMNILKAVNSRSKYLNPVLINYQIHTVSKVEYTFFGEIARKGDKLRIFYNAPEIFDDKITNQPKNYLRIFDGKRSVIFNSTDYLDMEDHPFYRISADPQKIIPHTPPDSISGDQPLRNVIDYILNGDSGFNVNITTKQESNEKEVLYIDIQNRQSKSVVKVWVIPEYGYGINRIEVYDDKGNLSSISMVAKHELIGDIFFPMSAEKINYSNGQITKKSQLSITKISLKGSEISDSLFRVSIPSNAVIEDMDTGQILISLSDVQAYLDGIGLGQFRFRSRFYVILCVNLLGIAILLFINRKALKKLLYEKILHKK